LRNANLKTGRTWSTKPSKKRAYGFWNKEHFGTAIYFQCGGLELYPAM
jgi:hypothetical protein